MGLKVIFSKQLPNMPKEYICRWAATMLSVLMPLAIAVVQRQRAEAAFVGHVCMACCAHQRWRSDWLIVSPARVCLLSGAQAVA
jgi:hypothetical protein